MNGRARPGPRTLPMLRFGPYDKQLSGSQGRAVFLVHRLLRFGCNE